jgi:hypothetical protein
MTKTITFGKNVKTVQMMILAGDKVLLVDAATGLPPKKVASRIVGKDLHIFADGAAESSAILIDYTEFASVQIQGVERRYYDYTTRFGRIGAFIGAVAVAVVETDGFMTTAAWWGVGILALGGAAAVALSGGGSVTLLQQLAVVAEDNTSINYSKHCILVDALVPGVASTSSGLTGVTRADGSFDYRTGDTITFRLEMLHWHQRSDSC